MLENKRQSQKKDELHCKVQQVSIDTKDIENLPSSVLNSIAGNSHYKIQLKKD
ncbi:hypothetical protein LCS82_09065 [Vibrio harveyi]|uniref:hypothetical protein n=1 Tax=Vibrio harveyi TaxID=669 RepID=UPI003BB65116